MTDEKKDDAVRDLTVPPKLGDARELPPTQRALFQLALSVMVAIAIVTVVILLDWMLDRPGFPTFPVSGKKEDVDLALSFYEKAVQIRSARDTGMFDVVVLKGLLPVLTAVVGGVIGYQAGRQRES